LPLTWPVGHGVFKLVDHWYHIEAFKFNTSIAKRTERLDLRRQVLELLMTFKLRELKRFQGHLNLVLLSLLRAEIHHEVMLLKVIYFAPVNEMEI